MLADAGYDVLLGSQRGCAYSRRHKKWTRQDPRYWRYTLDDVALYDMPALVSMAQPLWGERRLFYVGYSAGTHSLYALLQLPPDLRPSLRAALLLAAAVLFTRHHNPLIKALASFPDRTLDAQLLSRKSSLNFGVFVMPPEDWDHFDYVANTQAPRLIYDRILGVIAGL
ncbi:lipase member K-like [Schistocerca cancellata]|uniref:lipase member K-like n=1 Tax=Schistocerca cancellata TaxID=274614 RepID=UPI00211949A5|nr:lipase member K-like [Schistocerca cancellata]